MHRLLICQSLLACLATSVWSLPINPSLVDLSYDFNNNTLHWITARPFEMRVLANGTKQFGDKTMWYQMEEIQLSTHTGTHMDAPCHFSKGSWCVADIPLENLHNRPAVVIDISEACYSNRDYEMSIKDIQDHEAAWGRIEDGSVVLVRTGWGRFWPIQEQYFGTETNDVSKTRFPGIHRDAAQWLMDNREIVGIGIEGPSIDNGLSIPKHSHEIMGKRNVYFIENVSYQVRFLPPVGATLMVMPMKLDSASGAPVRVIANLKPSAANSAIPAGLRHLHSLNSIITLIVIVITTLGATSSTL